MYFRERKIFLYCTTLADSQNDAYGDWKAHFFSIPLTGHMDTGCRAILPLFSLWNSKDIITHARSRAPCVIRITIIPLHKGIIEKGLFRGIPVVGFSLPWWYGIPSIPVSMDSAEHSSFCFFHIRARTRVLDILSFFTHLCGSCQKSMVLKGCVLWHFLRIPPMSMISTP